ncbi:hypothetical protein SUNI508_12313 [Seiridium unicorne]|uniref:Ankyrin repeat protein n=1 Tax=Seiridium unicorne TaxID=138068 RepID=A0ABR2UE45_9PEZI
MGTARQRGFSLRRAQNFDIQNSQGLTALHLALDDKRLSIAWLLIEKGANCNIWDKTGRTVLHIAALHGLVPLVSHLIYKGVDVNILDEGQRSPLHLAGAHMQTAIIELLAMATDCELRDGNGRTAPHCAIVDSDEQAVRCLIQNCKNMNLVDDEGQSALHIASHAGRVNMVNLLLKSGASADQQDSEDVNLADKNRESALHFAARLGNSKRNKDLIECLLSMNANAGLRNSNGHENSFGCFILNPLRNPNEQETYSLTIPTSRLEKGITDGEILARFTRGFFGGIFTPEVWFLRTTGFSKTDTRVTRGILSSAATKTAGELAETPQIWERSEISRTSTPAFGTLFFGNFLVVDCSSVSSSQLEAISTKHGEFARPPCIYAEFIFGSENSRLLVSHRFEVRRSEGPGSEVNVKITFSHVRSTGRPGRLTMPASFVWFHVLYSKLLFSDGIREVLLK